MIHGASTTVGFGAAHKEELKLVKNGPKCKELGWVCIPLVVETYGGWGVRACETDWLWAHNEVAMRQELFGRLSLVLMRQNTQAILARSNWPGIFG